MQIYIGKSKLLLRKHKNETEKSKVILKKKKQIEIDKSKLILRKCKLKLRNQNKF